MLGLLCVLPSCASSPATPADAIEPVVEAKSQDDAWSLAKKSDLPQIARADRLELTIGMDTAKNQKVIKIDDAATLDAIRASLKITDDPPSAGEVDAKLDFYRGGTLVRTVWVYPYGEWGIRRPGVSWTCGASKELVAAIKAAAG